jgi:gamma-glutamylcyclotransferase (GGCT)/AIG2-like uncharacterized protein YtfP
VSQGGPDDQEVFSSRRTIVTISPIETARAINRAMVISGPHQHGIMEEHPGRGAPTLDLVFVYGSLKRGQSNHHLLATARFEGEAQAPGLSLHDLGPFPMAIAAAPSETGSATDPETVPVSGELFAVEAETLERLDRLEGVPRLYQRQRLVLLDGRLAWVYLGQPHQVRHGPRLAAGCWPALLLLLSALLGALAPASLRADTGLAACNRWQRSQGVSRIELGNQIGAAHYLTKLQRLQQSPPQAPVALYAASDLQRACDNAR